MTTPSIRARAPRSAAPPRPIRCRNAPGSCGPIWDRSPRPSCRCGSRSPGRTAFARSCSPTCPATGSSARKTPATRCTSNGCTTTGASGSPARPAPMASRHLQLKFEEFDYGFIYKRIREDADERNPYWTVGRIALWPNGFYLGNHFEWRVPVDDENTLSVAWFFMRVPKGREPYVQDTVPTWVSPIKDENGRWISSHVINQDIIAWVGQGRDRRPHQGEYRRQRPRHRDDPQALLRRARRSGARRGRRKARSAAPTPHNASSCRTSRRRKSPKASRSRSTTSIRCSRPASRRSAIASASRPRCAAPSSRPWALHSEGKPARCRGGPSGRSMQMRGTECADHPRERDQLGSSTVSTTWMTPFD